MCLKVQRRRDRSEMIHTGFGMITSERCEIQGKIANKVGLSFIFLN